MGHPVHAGREAGQGVHGPERLGGDRAAPSKAPPRGRRRPAPRSKAARVEDLHDALAKHNAIRSLKCPEELGWRWQHLAPAFRALRARELTTARVNEYVLQRQREKASNGTINRELTALKRIYNVGMQADPPTVDRVPHLPHLKEAPPRAGFVEYADFQKLRFAAEGGPLWMRVFLELSYAYGLRCSELLGLRVRQVSFEAMTLRLNPGETKNDEGREVTLTPRLAALLRHATANKEADDHVLTRPNGRAVKDLRPAWPKLLAKCGLTNHAHDMRRSGVRNLVRAGVSEKVAMTISGHKTRSVFDRYNIVDARDKRAAMELLEADQARQEAAAISPLPESPFVGGG